MSCSQCSCSCFWLSVLSGYATTFVLWTAVLLIARYLVIDWEKRSMLATCYDPDSPEWGKPADVGIPQKWLDYGDAKGHDDHTPWNRCDDSGGNGLCTPWGYSCGLNSDWNGGEEPLYILCPLDFGGDGDGCRPPYSIFGETLPDMYGRNFGYVENPLFSEQAVMQNAILFYLSPLVCGLLGFFVIAPQRCRRRRFDAVAGDEGEMMETELSSFQDSKEACGYNDSTTDVTTTASSYHDKNQDAV